MHNASFVIREELKILRRGMEDLMGIGLFIREKFMEEDGDGMNLVLMSDRRIRMEKQMMELGEALIPAKVDSIGNKFFEVSVLQEVWEKSKRLTKYGE
jgi:hypothetical protein